VKILDFGLARAPGNASELTQPGALVGTPAYMSPEQARGERTDPRADLFSLGCVLYRMCTGQAPFRGPDMLAILTALAVAQPKPPHAVNPAVPSGLSDLTMRLLAKEPDDRPPSAQAVIEALASLEVASAASPLSSSPLEPRQARKEGSALAKKVPGARPAVAKARHWRPRLALALAALLAVVPLTVVYGPTVLRLATNRGELVIKTDDRDVEVTIRRPDGQPEVHVLDKQTQRQLVLRAGDYDIDVKERGGLRFATKKLTLSRGGREVVQAELLLATTQPPNAAHSEMAVPPVQRPAVTPAPSTILPASGRPEPAHIETVLGDTRWRHWNWVVSVAVSRDGKRIVSGSIDYTVTVWDAETGWELRTFREHKGPINAMALHPNGKVFASASWDRTVRLWDIEKGEPIFALPLEDGAHSVAFSPDGTILAGMTESVLRLWETATGKELRSIPTGKGVNPEYAGGFAFSPDGKTIAFRAGDDRVKLCETATGQEQRILKGHGQPVTCVAWSPDGKLLATATRRPTPVVTILDVETGAERHRLPCAESTEDVRFLAFAPDGRTLAAACYRADWVGYQFEGRARQWDVATGRQGPVMRVPGGQRGITGVAFTPDSKVLVTAGIDHRVRFWDLASGAARVPPGGAGDAVSAVALSSDGRTAAWVGSDETIRLFDLSAQKQSRFQVHRGGVTALAFVPGATILASAGNDRMIRLWDLASRVDRLQIAHQTGRLTFSPNGRMLVSPSWNPPADFKIWDPQTGLEALRLKEAVPASLTWEVISPDNTTLATTFLDQPVVLLDLATGKTKRQLTPADDPHRGAWQLAYSPDGKILAVAHHGPDPCPVRLWDTQTGQLRGKIQGPWRSAASLLFSPDGKTLATSTHYDGTVRLWDVATARQLRTLVVGPPLARVVVVAFTPDGRRLLTMNGNGTASILRLAP
jgi:WD40 repeat protein